MTCRVLLICFVELSALLSSGQPIPYGNNAAAGNYYSLRGFNMYCEVYGTGKPLLMIHGNGGSIRVFEKNIPYFSKKYKVIVADSRAHGKSKDDRDSLSFEMMADDYAALLDAMHIDSCYVIGWSDGGINALLLAIKKLLNLLRPELIYGPILRRFFRHSGDKSKPHFNNGETKQ